MIERDASGWFMGKKSTFGFCGEYFPKNWHLVTGFIEIVAIKNESTQHFHALHLRQQFVVNLGISPCQGRGLFWVARVEFAVG